eukprot:gene12234-biopygen2714
MFSMVASPNSTPPTGSAEASWQLGQALHCPVASSHPYNGTGVGMRLGGGCTWGLATIVLRGVTSGCPSLMQTSNEQVKPAQQFTIPKKHACPLTAHLACT